MDSSEAPPAPTPIPTPIPTAIQGVEVEQANNQEDEEDNEEEDPPELSGFDRIQGNFKALEDLISDIQEAFETPAGVDVEPGPDTNAGRRMEKVRKDVKHIRKNVEYIKKNVDPLKSSSYSDGAEELLRYLMDAAEKQTVDDFPEDSDNLKHLLHIIAKLKHWVPPPSVVVRVSTTKKKSNKEKNESPIVSKADNENAIADIVRKLVSNDCQYWGMDGLLKSYQQLKVRDQLCLLCFSVFLCEVHKVRKHKELVAVQQNLVIKKRILIYWWVAEGFIQPIHRPNPNSTTIPDSADPNPNPSTNADPHGTPIPDHYLFAEGNQISKQAWPPPEDEGKTIEQIGENILIVLREKGFIEPVIKRGRESGSYQMHPFVHAFVTALARNAGFFDFSNVDGKLTYRFALSQRACLVKSVGKLSSSCRRWKEAIDNRDELKKFATVQTLFNVNEAIIDIQPEWFSKMKHLSVLHLGSWRSEAGEHIEVEDPKFMEELKIMKQLKLFSLQGVATIMKLPDSICKLSNLIILDLRECHNLEELPAKIGELKNLTHLDLTNCHLLTKLPKGISLLSKLQVLNWFVIYNQDGKKEVPKGCTSRAWKKTKGFVVHDVFRYENKEVCTLKDLLKLGNLRELSIVVNRNEFPSKYEAEVLMKMRELCTLKISWVYDFEDNDKNSIAQVQQLPPCDNNMNSTAVGQPCDNNTNSTAVGQPCDNNTSSTAVAQVQPPSKCGSCFCCKKREENTQQGEDMNKMRFRKLEKLELWCFPGKELPSWLVPNKLEKLKKLYIKGGKLTSFGEGNETWNVETLRLKYMKELKIEWRVLTAKFPNMTYLEKFQCKQLGLFPCDHEGVWINKETIPHCDV